MSRSIGARDVQEACKQVLTELAVEKISNSGDQISISRLSILTGIDRREIVRIYKRGEPPNRSPDTLVMRVLGQWHYDSRFCTSSGKPRVLQFEGKQSEFCNLVRAVSRHQTPYAVLYELERMGAVERTPKGLRLKKVGVLADDNLEQSVKMMASDTADMMSAIEENVGKVSEIPNYHLVTEFDNIDSSAVPNIRKWLLREGGKFHRRAREFLSRHDIDLNPTLYTDGGGTKVIVGGFSRVVS